MSRVERFAGYLLTKDCYGTALEALACTFCSCSGDDARAAGNLHRASGL